MSMKIAGLDVEQQAARDVDDDGLPRRTGTVWTTAAHIITAVIGSGVLSLAWSMAQLGWVAGTIALIMFAAITYYNSSLLADCYRTGDKVTGKRNYTYTDAVTSYLSRWQVWFCGLCQYTNLVGTAIGYTITASLSASAVYKSNCFHRKGHSADCSVWTSTYMLGFGVAQILFSQIPNFHKMAWLSTVAAVMSFCYATIGAGLSLAQILAGPTGKTTLGGTEVEAAQKIWLALQALGNIAFAYSYPFVLIEIQNTVRSPPAENKTMRKANLISISTTTAFYLLSGCLGYGAFGNAAPGNMLTGFGFYEPFWLIDIANVCIVVHLVGAYQVFSQPIFAAVEDWAGARWPKVNREYPIITGKLSFNILRLTWRTAFVCMSTLLAIVFPFFNDIVGLLGALGFWPLTVYFPVEMYIRQKKLKKSSGKWMALQIMSTVCFIVSLSAVVASVRGITTSLQHYVPFKSKF